MIFYQYCLPLLLMICGFISQHVHVTANNITRATMSLDSVYPASTSHPPHRPAGDLPALLQPGRCKHIWRTDPLAHLPGKCFAGPSHRDHKDPAVKELSVVNYRECRSLCCNLGELCNTWQFQNSTGLCKIEKGFVRRGNENAPTDLYCDPFAPVAWNGKMLKTRNTDGTCDWAYTMPAQCFAFGMEKLGVDKSRMDTNQCEAACCHDATCNSYQEYPGRGCYYGVSTCKHEEVEAPYEGGRKCVPKYCGGWEDKILGKTKP